MSLRPVDLYQEFVARNLGTLIREAETALGYPVTALDAPGSIGDARGVKAPRTFPDALARFLAPSAVSSWMRLAQLRAAIPQLTLATSLGLTPDRLEDLLDFHPPALAEARSVWFLWSLTFCPSNLSSGFHLLTWGLFNTADTGHVRLFELDRVRKGFIGCRFVRKRGRVPLINQTRILGALEYQSPVADPLAPEQRVTLAKERSAAQIRREEARAVAWKEGEAARRAAAREKEALRKEKKELVAARRAAMAVNVAFKGALTLAKKEARRLAQAEFIREVVNRHQLGQLQTEIAAAMGVDQPRIGLILNRLGFRTYRKHRFGGD